MTSLNWTLATFLIFCTLHVIKCFTNEKTFHYHCNEIYTLGIDDSFTVVVESGDQIEDGDCKIGFQGQGTNFIDIYRVCVNVINDGGDICNGSITFSQGWRGKEDHRRTQAAYNCSDLPSQWCGDMETKVYIDFKNMHIRNSSQTALRLEVILESSNSYMKSIVVILSLILGAIVITVVVSCIIRCCSRKRKRLSSLSIQCPEDVNYGSNQKMTSPYMGEEKYKRSKIFASYHNRIHAPCILYMNVPTPPPYTTQQNSHDRDGVSCKNVSDSIIPPPPYTVH